MKTGNIILFAIIFSSITFLSFKYTNDFVNNAFQPQEVKFEIPENVKAIIDNKCYDCHNSSSKNKKAKMKLDFDKLETLKAYKLVGKLDNLSESVRELEMPPKKAIEKYPQLKLTKEEINAITGWADDYVNKLTGE